jgi:hypothetical protein
LEELEYISVSQNTPFLYPIGLTDAMQSSKRKQTKEKVILSKVEETDEMEPDAIVEYDAVDVRGEELVPITLKLPTGLVDFWTWYARLYGLSAEEQLAREAEQTAFSLMDQLEAAELARMHGLARIYDKWRSPGS